MASAGKSARQKGHGYELAIKSAHEEIGFKDVYTSRNESKRLDDAGVDLAGLPYYVQCKAVERLTPSLHDILSSMLSDRIRAVFHKRNRKGTVVSMPMQDWMNILKFLKEKGFFI
jgi:hypothetical protein